LIQAHITHVAFYFNVAVKNNAFEHHLYQNDEKNYVSVLPKSGSAHQNNTLAGFCFNGEERLYNLAPALHQLIQAHITHVAFYFNIAVQNNTLQHSMYQNDEKKSVNVLLKSGIVDRNNTLTAG